MIYYLTVGLFYQTKSVAQSAKSRISARAAGQGVDLCSGQLSTQRKTMEDDKSVRRSGGEEIGQDRQEMSNMKDYFKTGTSRGIIGIKWRQDDRYNVKEMQQSIGISAREWGYHKWTKERERY